MGSSGKDAVEDAKRAADKQLQEMQAEQQIAQAAVEKQKQAYKDFEFQNVYGGIQTEFENVYEDLTVNQQQAQFQARQGAQQRANIMQGLQGAAGASGIAGLAQAMAQQGQLQTGQISASIGQQEAANQAAMARGAAGVQRMESAAEITVAGGAAAVQQAESGRVATLLGMEYGGLQAAQAGVQGAYGAQQSAAAMELERVNANKAMWAGLAGDVLGAGATVLTGGLAQGGFLRND